MIEVATADAPVYRSRTGDTNHDSKAVIAVWQGNLGTAQNLVGKFDWFYRDCPWGSPVIQLLYRESADQCIGVAAAGPRRMLCDGREIRAGVLVDFAVLPGHRSLGPALQLQTALIAASAAQFDLLYGLPNLKAVPVFRRLGYVPLGELVRYARILRHGDYLRRRLPRVIARPLGWAIDRARAMGDLWTRLRTPGLTPVWSDCIDPRMDELWQRSAPDHGLIAMRDSAMLRWRFDAAPRRQTRYLLLCTPNGEELLAWFACEADGSTLHVRDFWSADAHSGIHRRFVDALVVAATASSYSAVSVEFSGAPSALQGWLAARFVERARQPVFGKWLRPGTIPAGLSIHLTPLVEDE